MKKSLTALAALAFAGAIASGALAEGPVGRFDNGYLDEHPEVAHQLGANPSLADNPQFLATHPGLDGYLSQSSGSPAGFAAASVSLHERRMAPRPRLRRRLRNHAR